MQLFLQLRLGLTLFKIEVDYEGTDLESVRKFERLFNSFGVGMHDIDLP